MSRAVLLLPRARQQLFAAAEWWSVNRSPQAAARWLTGMELAINQLQDDAERFPFADEAESLGVPLRQTLFGLGSRPTHRILFEIEETAVFVYAIRHVAQREIPPDDLI